MRGVLVLGLVATLAISLLGAGYALGGDPRATSGAARSAVYIVQMIEDPVIRYDGGVPGYSATVPGAGEKVDRDDADVARYAAYLEARHTAVLDSVGGRKLYDYRYSFNGFAAELSETQAGALSRNAGVVLVTPDELHSIDTSSTPTFLGLDAPGGLWDRLGGLGCGGKGIVIGVVDSGIWPESASFSDGRAARDDDDEDGEDDDEVADDDCIGDTYPGWIGGWRGTCIPGEAFPASSCNRKLIGARHFNAGWGGDAGIEAQRPWEFTSPRDYNGHGTHTSSTAGGNYGVIATGPAAVFGTISGMAPRAHIAMYKALWSTEDASTASGFTSDLVAAIDQAVADGVDVINYSISGTRTNFLEPVQVAFLFAADAGVFVSASAGNSGPTTATVAHPSPWLTTVAAGTHNRGGTGSVTLGNGATYTGASLATTVGPAPLIDSTAAGLPGADPGFVRLCYAAIDNGGVAVLDPAVVAGKIVVCDRGVTARVNKGLAVQQAGGVGMILLNVVPGSLNADFHFVPTVHLAHTDYAAVKAYVATTGATATIHAATILYDVPAPFTAAFSSRGPLLAAGGDLLKPDVIAPGVDVLAAVAPPGNAGREFNLYSGTSMSAPHVAGLAALLKDLHRDWSPMMIKSALMTSATDVLDGANTNPTVIFRQGAGHVRPNSAADPGLVYDSGFNDWLAFLCGTGQLTASYCPGIRIDPSDLNVASIAFGNLAGVQSVTRRVTNVGDSRATYSASVAGMGGIDVVVNPSALTLKTGRTGTFTVTFTRTTAALNAYTGGQLTWSDGTHDVRIPLVVRPVALAAPAQVSGTGGAISYGVTFGYTGTFSATARGLVPATTFTNAIFDDPTDTFVPGGPGTQSYTVTVPAGSTYARFSLFDANVDPASDLDLYVYRGATLVGASGGSTSAEEVNLVNPAAADYTVWVHGWGVPLPGPATYTLFTWVLGTADAGNMVVSAPSTALLGSTATIDLTFSGLAPGTRYLGSVAYSGSTGMPNPTIVRVDTP